MVELSGRQAAGYHRGMDPTQIVHLEVELRLRSLPKELYRSPGVRVLMWQVKQIEALRETARSKARLSPAWETGVEELTRSLTATVQRVFRCCVEQVEQGTELNPGQDHELTRALDWASSIAVESA